MAEQTLLERATVIRDEQEEALNTAHRVGSTIVLAAQEIARRVTDIRATSSDVSAWLHLSYIDEDGTPREVRIDLPALTDSKAGVITPRQYAALFKAIAEDKDSAKALAKQIEELRQQHKTDIYALTGTTNPEFIAKIAEMLMRIENGDHRCFIDQSKGGSLAPGEEEEVTVTIFNGYGEDVTAKFTLFSVTRNTGDAASDALWNSRHTNVGNPFFIAFSDLGIDGIRKTVATFFVTASDEGTGDVAKAATATYFI